MMRFASDEVTTTVCATIEMSGCFSPVALAGAQSRFARGWFARASLSWMAMGMRAFEAPAAAMAPIRQAVIANARTAQSVTGCRNFGIRSDALPDRARNARASRAASGCQY
jgi:hypothetical protein